MLNIFKRKPSKDEIELDCVAYGTGNLARKIGQGYFFYDYDTSNEEEVKQFIIFTASQFHDAFVAFRTKHGVMIMTTVYFVFPVLKELFDLFQKNYPSDYMWDIPLFLRVSEKWSIKTGKVVSPMPQLYFNPRKVDIYKLIREDMLPKKWYKTRD